MNTEIDINTILILGLVAFLFYGGNQGWFKSETFVTNTETNNILEGTTILDSKESCFLYISKGEICTGDFITGKITNGINHNCYTFASDGTKWNLIHTGNTGDDGRLSASERINVEGSFTFRSICDINNNGIFDDGDCITNPEDVEVKDCTPPDTPPAYENGDNVGGADGSINLDPGSNGVSIPIDLGDFPPTTGGPCQLQALISTNWNYESEGACYGVPGQEGMKFSLKDSVKEVWSRTDYTPVALGSQTYCGLQWDGSTPWVFSAEKLFDFEGCGIILEYSIDVVTCDCEN